MHNRAEPRYATSSRRSSRTSARRSSGRSAPACRGTTLIVDPGFGFGKTPEHNLALLREPRARCAALGRPILLGTSRKSTLGRVLDLPADQRLEATLATTALGIAAGVDIVRVHDVRANVRAARIADAIVRGDWRDDGRTGRRDDRPDRARTAWRFLGRHGVHDGSSARPQPFEVDVELVPRPPAGRARRRPRADGRLRRGLRRRPRRSSSDQRST